MRIIKTLGAFALSAGMTTTATTTVVVATTAAFALGTTACSGADGLHGEKGEKGDTGADGQDGADGEDGEDGQDGTNGSSSSSGGSGTTGGGCCSTVTVESDGKFWYYVSLSKYDEDSPSKSDTVTDGKETFRFSGDDECDPGFLVITAEHSIDVSGCSNLDIYSDDLHSGDNWDSPGSFHKSKASEYRDCWPSCGLQFLDDVQYDESFHDQVGLFIPAMD